MTSQNRFFAIIALFLLVCGTQIAFAQQTLQVGQTTVQVPQATAPQAFTILGQFVRVANNKEGFAVLGYRTTQESQGQDWVLLNVGITVLQGVDSYKLKREHLSLKMPDGTMVPLASVQDFRAANSCRNLVLRDNKINDSINYWPSNVSRGCVIGFFGQQGTLAYDQVELSSDRGCMGRLFFKVPGGVKPGQYWLYIQFPNSQLQVPFRILTAQEREEFAKSWQDIKKAYEDSLKQ